MKIITLNTWGGRAGREEHLAFFKKYKDRVDVFCLQEIWRDAYKMYEGKKAGGVSMNYADIMTQGFQEISAILTDHVPYFRPHFGDDYGLVTFVKKGITVLEEGEKFVYKEKGYKGDDDIGDHARNIQHAKIAIGDRALTIINFHGLWTGKGKNDTPERLEQSKKIVDYIQTVEDQCLLCGDFNLMPETESVKMIENAGLKNLIKEYGVTSTRTHFYKKTPDQYADYVFVSPGLKVIDFKVLPEVVSDHAALFCEVEVV